MMDRSAGWSYPNNCKGISNIKFHTHIQYQFEQKQLEVFAGHPTYLAHPHVYNAFVWEVFKKLQITSSAEAKEGEKNLTI